MTRLNIGSGRDYRAGFINVDLHDPLADVAQSVHLLKFADESAAEITASQLVEHLGFFKALCFFSEAYRALRPDGKLIIETPDIESAFARFSAAPRPARERLMQWIYGLETPGMGHVFCFPRELLEEKLRGQGFEITAVEKTEAALDNPALRITARKSGSAAKMAICRLRRALVESGLLDFSEETLSAQYEALLSRIAALIEKTGGKPDDAALRECLYEAAVCAPAVTQLFQTLAAPDSEPGLYLKAARILEGASFTARCESEFLSIPPAPMGQEAAYRKIAGWSRRAVDRVLSGETVCDACSAGETDMFGGGAYRKRAAAFFSPALLSRKGMLEFAEGAKLFALKDYPAALRKFESSLRYYRDCPETWLNLGRLCAALRQPAQSRKYYEGAARCCEAAGDAEAARRMLPEADEICSSIVKEPAIPWRAREER